MKKYILIILALAATISQAQYRDDVNKQTDVRSGIVNNNSFGSIFGLINSDNFSMHHSFGLSYTAFGGFGGMALGVYTNSMAYKFSDRLNLETDISVVNSPYNSFGQGFSKQINGVYLSRVQMTYKPTDNMNIILQYRQMPGGLYSPYSYSGYSLYDRDNYFNNWGF
ncbi:MAG: hypothetical protein FIA82_01845 [Melioribacter sp.]|nr:hypothetical protein [Melioribacter sp.]